MNTDKGVISSFVSTLFKSDVSSHHFREWKGTETHLCHRLNDDSRCRMSRLYSYNTHAYLHNAFLHTEVNTTSNVVHSQKAKVFTNS